MSNGAKMAAAAAAAAGPSCWAAGLPAGAALFGGLRRGAAAAMAGGAAGAVMGALAAAPTAAAGASSGYASIMAMKYFGRPSSLPARARASSALTHTRVHRSERVPNGPCGHADAALAPAGGDDGEVTLDAVAPTACRQGSIQTDNCVRE